MLPPRWSRVEQVFHQAADLPPHAQDMFLDEACEGDEELRHSVEELLAADVGNCTFWDSGIDYVQAAIESAVNELPETDDLIGQRVGRYTIDRLIGKGGMGAVYHAVREDDFRMEVAVKLLKRGTDTDEALSRFRAERQILAGLQHPNIARLLDGGATETGLPYLVMEYVDGTPLMEYAGPLELPARLQLFRQICAAVQYAHQNLIVHRDIKPSNILVTAGGTPKLLDFGIAKLLGTAAGGGLSGNLTAAGAAPLTPEYASPEQVRGEQITTATDVYSLGVVLYELLTGTKAIHIESWTPAAIQTVICTREPKKPSSVAPNIDADLDNIVLMALRKEPHRRYASAEQFSDDLRLYLERRPVRARKDTLRYRTAKFLRRNRTAVTIAVLFLLGLLAGIAAIDRQARRAENRFQQVRKLANTVLFDLNGEIENLAGSTRAREMLVRTSLEYLDSLAAEAGDDPALQLELANAYERIGDVQGNPMYSNLGRASDSLMSYSKVHAMAERLPPTQAVLELRVRARYKTGCIFRWALGRVSDAREHLREAARLAESIPAQTGQPSWRVRVEAHGFLGDMETYLDPVAAIGPLRRSLEIARDWAGARGDPDSRYHVSIATGRLAIALQETGDLPNAHQLLLAALQAIQELMKEDPHNAVWLRESHALYDRLGWVTGHPQYINLDDRKAAAGWVDKMLGGEEGAASAEQLSALDPANVRGRFELSEALAARAAVSRESDPARAERLYRKSLDISASVLTLAPEDANAAFWQAFNRVGFAWVLEARGKRAEALGQLDSAVNLLQRLRAKDPNDMRFREYLGLALHTRAGHRLRAGQRDAAVEDVERSRSYLEPLFRENPRKLTRLRDLADCYRVMGDIHVSRSDWKLAQQWYEKSLGLWERWKEVGAVSVYDTARRNAVARLAAEARRRSAR